MRSLFCVFSTFCVFSAAALLLGLGCGPKDSPPRADPPASDTTVTDALGRTVTLPSPPRRILSLAPNLTEMLYAVGAGDRLVGRSQSDTFPEAVLDLPSFSTFPLEPEGVVALEPDLLLATDQINSPADAEPFARLGLPTYFFSFDEVADVPAAMRTLGALLHVNAEAAAAAFEARLDSVVQAVADLAPPRTLLLVGDETLYAFGRESYASEAVRLAGGDNLTDAFGGAAPVLSDEWVLEAAPEVIVVLAGWDYDPARLLDHHPTWTLVPAVAEGRVYGFDPDLLSRPGPRLAEGIARLAALLHPAAGS